jgi:L-threonylcarbamoyladenylate synthase
MTNPLGVLAFATDDEIGLALPSAAGHLAAGGVLAYPTETVYGLGGDVDEASVRAVAALKGRADDKPFLILVDGRPMIERHDLDLTADAEALAEAFWPGPLTIVLRGGGSLPARVRGPGGGVAVRWTSHAAVTRLIAAHGRPLTSTSANPAGRPVATTASAIAAEWPSQVARGELLILNGGPLRASVPSTVVDCTGGAARLVRAGAIPSDSLRAVVPHLIVDAGTG